MQYSFPNYREARAKDLLKKRIVLLYGYNYVEVYDDIPLSKMIDTVSSKIEALDEKRISA